MGEIRYSICATHYNNAEYIKESAGVLADVIEGRDEYELVVTDAGSTDGSLSYLQDLAEEQENVRVVVEKGINIGEGRRLAANVARGDVTITIMDLDANYHDDDRLFEVADYYEQLVAEEGDVVFVTDVMFCSQDLLEELGGWKPFPANEETDFRRRALRAGTLRFCPIEFYDENAGEIKGIRDGAERFFLNSKAKFRSGVGFWWMLAYWVVHAPGWRPKLGAFVVLPAAWYAARQSDTDFENAYDRHDRFILDFRQSVYRHHPEYWLETPEHLSAYHDEAMMAHVREES